MNKDDVVKVRGKDIGIIVIPAEERHYGLRQYFSFNLVEMEDGTLKALLDDELEIIQASIEE